MIPVLFDPAETTFTSNGLGALSDALSCKVLEERNGEYELTMTYPVTGIHYSDIADRCIITAIPSPYRTAQPFRIYEIETPINGVVTIHAHHISYDLSGVPVSPFTASSCASALSGLLSNAVVSTPFTVGTNKSVSATFTLSVPSSFRSLLGGKEGSILDVYGTGEYLFDKFSVYLYTKRGSDNGVTVAYGKNLTDFKMDRNLDDMVTGVYPYWSDVEGNNVVECSPKVIDITGGLDRLVLRDVNSETLRSTDGDILTVSSEYSRKIKILDMTSYFSEQPTANELYTAAVAYIADNDLTSPKVSIDVSFVELAKTDEYKSIAVLEQCDLCDTVTVQFPGVAAKAEIVRIQTDVLREKYDSMEIGDARTTISDTIAEIKTSSVTKTEMKTGLAQAADVINNTSGVFKFIDNGDGTNAGFTIYESDNVAFLRCTAGGIGLSEDGGLTYTNAITKNGVVATQIDVDSNGVDVLASYYDSYYDNSYLIMKDSVYNNPALIIRAGRIINASPGYEGGETHMYLYNAKTGGVTWSCTSSYYDDGSLHPTSAMRMYDPDPNVTYERVSIQAWSNSSGTNAKVQISRSGGNAYISIGESAGTPYMSVYDVQNSVQRSLGLKAITISGTTYYIMAAT